MRIHQVAPKIYHTYSKIWVNRDWVIRFLGFFLVISEVGSQIYIANLVIFKIWVFSATFRHEITLYAIDIDKKRFRTPLLHSRTTLKIGLQPDSTFWNIWEWLISFCWCLEVRALIGSEMSEPQYFLLVYRIISLESVWDFIGSELRWMTLVQIINLTRAF